MSVAQKAAVQGWQTCARAACALWLLAWALPAGAQPAPPPSPVAVSTVVAREIAPTVPVTGSIYSRNEVQITLGVEGQLVLVAEPGTRLRKGEPVAAIDTLPLELSLAEQQAQVERASAQLKYLEAQLRRQQDLRERNSTSANQLEQTESERDVAVSDLRIADLRIRQIQDQLRRARVAAPFDGVVVERLRREGEDVARGTVVARLTDTENLEVRVFAPLRYAGRVQAGDKLRLFGFETEQHGVVRSVVPSADMRSQTFELRIDLPEDAPANWAIGQLVSVSIPLRAGRETVAVHRDALILRQDGTYVFRITPEGLAERIPVETGDSDGDLIAVSANLRPGDRVVIRGAETLTDGHAVAILGGASSGGEASP